jgi:GT2 family glycosyltransferase
MPDPTTGISIVTFNSRYLRPCLNAVFAQRGVQLDIVVVDSASTDYPEILDEFADQVRIIRNTRNLGFAEAQNQGIRTSREVGCLRSTPTYAWSPISFVTWWTLAIWTRGLARSAASC